MKIKLHFTEWYLKPFKDHETVGKYNYVTAKTYSILCVTIYKYK